MATRWTSINGGNGQFTYGSSDWPQDANNLRGSYGAADYDVRHSFNASYVWEVPVKGALRGHGRIREGMAGLRRSSLVPAFLTQRLTSRKPAIWSDNIFGTIYSVPVAPLGSTGPCGKGAVIPASSVPCLPTQVLGGFPESWRIICADGLRDGIQHRELARPAVHAVAVASHSHKAATVFEDQATSTRTSPS